MHSKTDNFFNLKAIVYLRFYTTLAYCLRSVLKDLPTVKVKISKLYYFLLSQTTNSLD